MPRDLVNAKSDAAVWNRVIQFYEELSPTAARALLKIKFSEMDQRRLTDLSNKARRGTLSDQEEELASTYKRLGCLLDILHSKARRVLKRRGRTAS